MKSIVTIGFVGLSLALAACGGSDKPPPGELQHLGAPESQLRLVALPGYVEDGSTDPSLDWVTPFERNTGCRVSTTVASAPDEVAGLMRTGQYDGVSARGDVSGILVAEHLVSPVNTELIPSYSQLFPALKRLSSNRIEGVTYGVPNGRLANLLLWRPSAVVTPRDEPVSSNMLFDPTLVARYPGGVAAYGDPMYIADAALYLRHHDHDLGIDNVYELDQDQFDAAIALLRQQRPNAGVYWRTSGQNVKAFASNRSVVGTAWQLTINGLLAKHVKIRAGAPEEGLTGIAESWMISSQARHPNCMYMWINYITGARANAALAEHTGQAPANEHACDLTQDPAWCDTYHAADEGLFNRVRFWLSPLRDCGDGRGDVCKTYDDWARAFAEVMSGR